MKKTLLLLSTLTLFYACSSDDEGPVDNDTPEVIAPASYTFERNGESTVSFSGQSIRIAMAEELGSAMMDVDNSTVESLMGMYAHREGESDFSDPELNASNKNIRSKTAASRDYFSANTAEAATIKTAFEGYIEQQVSEVFPAWNQLAEAGQPGQIADGDVARYVDARGLEMDQALTKGLIGALMVDQMLNNYLSVSVLDEANNVSDNDNEVLAEGANYTTMEHKWDEAFGYLFGASPDPANPLQTLEQDDSFLNKYLGRVDSDPDFEGIGQTIFDAFKLGRAAIVAKNYQLRNQQAAIIRQAVSEVIAIRAVYYLQQGKNALLAGNLGTAFHDLSEGYGFIFSLRFTRNNSDDQSFFSRAVVEGFLTDLMDDGPNGLWDVEPATLDALSEAIAAPFSFTVSEAGSSTGI